jgi:hypothetical protein
MQKRERQRGDRQQRPNPKRYLDDDRRGDKSRACEDGTMLDQFGDMEQLKNANKPIT